ncbi:MAG: transcriptional regulator NrdR [Alphaproteobacteria bacterium]
MRCPFCAFEDTQVRDSRSADDGSVIRRRRSCNQCGGRFTTFERVQLRELVVIKSGERRENFDPEKLRRSMAIALRKRPVSSETLDKVVNAIIRQLESSGDSDIPAGMIGEKAMDALAQLDQVAYVRYASVYRNFREAADFQDFLDSHGLERDDNNPPK